MSFYGNSFYYTAESFARVVLQNSGLNKYISTPDNGFTEAPKDTGTELDALQRNSGLGIQSGNHWIKLASSGNTFQILHGEPGCDSADNTTFTTIQSAVKEAKSGNGAVLLDFGQQLEMPVIKYDAMGHVFNDGTVTYVQMPANPSAQLEGRMQQIDGKNALGNDEEPVGGSLKKNLYTRMKTIDGRDENGDLDEDYPSVKKELNDLVTNLNSNLGLLDKAVADSGDALTKSEAALSDVTIVKNTFKTLDERIKALEEKAGVTPADPPATS